jgi:hypothetical protein
MSKRETLTNYERETLISFNEDEKTASVYTYNGRLIRKLQDYCKRFPGEFKLVKYDQEWGSYTFEVPKCRVNITCPKIMSEVQKENLKNLIKANKQSIKSESL